MMHFDGISIGNIPVGDGVRRRCKAGTAALLPHRPRVRSAYRVTCLRTVAQDPHRVISVYERPHAEARCRAPPQSEKTLGFATDLPRDR